MTKNSKKLEDVHVPMAICNYQVPKVRIDLNSCFKTETYSQSPADQPIKASSNAKSLVHLVQIANQDALWIPSDSDPWLLPIR